ncbi:MAG: sugar ABC transporter permease [Lachnospiraceae bacterium]|jgi:ABC-type sugar transport system permease subunit|nr:sugar ABC transporter permease [Lachnospiraceae bacterium]
MSDHKKRQRKVRLFGDVYNLSEMGVGTLLLIPSIVFLVFTFVIPVIQVIQLSFTNYNTVTGAMNSVGFSNYVYLLTGSSSANFYQALGHTAVYAVVRLSFDLTLALLIAVMLDSKIPMKKFLRASYFAPVVVPIVASSLIWIWFYDVNIGPFNQILSALGLPTSKWLLGENTSLMSILIFSIWKGLGYNIILFLAGLQNISDTYIDAGKIDGASNWQLFWRIKFPLLRPIVSFVLLMDFIEAFKAFTEVDVMTPNGGPMRSTMLLVNYIYELAFTNGRMGRAAACALILFVIIFVFTIIQRKIGANKTVDYD